LGDGIGSSEDNDDDDGGDEAEVRGVDERDDADTDEGSETEQWDDGPTDLERPEGATTNALDPDTLLWWAGLELAFGMLDRDGDVKAAQVRYSVLAAKSETAFCKHRIHKCGDLLHQARALKEEGTTSPKLKLADVKAALSFAWSLVGVELQSTSRCCLTC
jgi:hypothetical protein